MTILEIQSDLRWISKASKLASIIAISPTDNTLAMNTINTIKVKLQNIEPWLKLYEDQGSHTVVSSISFPDQNDIPELYR